jgi:hypothetical protein
MGITKKQFQAVMVLGSLLVIDLLSFLCTNIGRYCHHEGSDNQDCQ